MAIADVPRVYDLWLDGQGYVLMDTLDERGAFGFSPTFEPRSNTQGSYGDEQQAFWLATSQADWSLGEQQKYFRGNDDEKKRRYWRGKNVDVRVPGEVTVRQALLPVTLAAIMKTGGGVAATDTVYVASASNLYYINTAGTATIVTADGGAHGLNAAPSRFGFASDAANIYLTTLASGTVGVRKYNGVTFSTFSATGADSIAFLNNSLYGFRNTSGTGDLIRYSSVGVVETLFTWKWADGTAVYGVTTQLIPFGGQLYILRYRNTSDEGAELWVYDGTGTKKLAQFPANFVVMSAEVVAGVLLIGGAFQRLFNTALVQKPAIMYYDNGQQDILWQAEGAVASTLDQGMVLLAPYDGGCVFWDAYGYLGTGRIRYYDATTGGVSTLSEGATFTDRGLLLTASSFFVGVTSTSANSGAQLFPSGGVAPADPAGEVDSSLIDFDSSLPKLFRGVRADFDKPSGTSVNLLYRFDNTGTAGDTSYSTLQTGVTSGVEYAIPAPVEGTTYHAISVRAQLIGSVLVSPTLKRITVRAVPVHPGYQRRQYVLNCTGREGNSPVILRNGKPHPKTGLEMAADLETAAQRTAPFSIKDHLGTFTGVIENDGLEMVTVRPGEYIARVRVRAV